MDDLGDDVITAAGAAAADALWTVASGDIVVVGGGDVNDDGDDDGTAAIKVSSVTAFSGVTRPVGSDIPQETLFWDTEDDVVDVEEQDE